MKRVMNLRLKNKFLQILLIVSLFSAVKISSQEKGKDALWKSAGKQGIGTALSLKSKVWFTLQGGSLTEVFYPTADKANVQVLQFVVFNRRTEKVETERENATHKIIPSTAKKTITFNQNYQGEVLDALTFTQLNTAESGAWEILKTYVTDPNADVVLINIYFLPKEKDLELYIYYDPSLNNSGMKDTAWTEDGSLLANEDKIFSALVVGFPENHYSANALPAQFTNTANGFSGINDGLTQLTKQSKIENLQKAENGNVVQFAQIPLPQNNQFTIALGFSDSAKDAIRKARQSLFKGFRQTAGEYRKSWEEYLKTVPQIEPQFQSQFNFAAMTLRAMEDKTFRGGNVASLSKPWIPVGDANGEYVGGYHLVWSRDLYQVATAYIALGDTDSANRALDYLFTKQQKPDGSYPQISWLDGRTLGDGLQMDEVSYPLILAYQLGRNDRETYEKHIKPTANFIARTGPKTGQERWEEKGGYSPSTIAAEIAGLVCAADIAQKNADEVSAKNWLAKADDWTKKVESWTATTNGKYGDGNYYIRLSANGNPNAGAKIELNNNAGIFPENEIVDAGFLELVRLGIKSPSDPLIVKSLKVVDEVLRVNTPNGEGFYRYNHDGYGEFYDGRAWNYDRKWSGKGHLWALLSGERGQYEIALKSQDSSSKTQAVNPQARLQTMANFANEGMMIPEQVWSQPNGVFQFGEGAGSATPLAWSMAQFIRLAVNLKHGKNLDTPEVVARRYGNL